MKKTFVKLWPAYMAEPIMMKTSDIFNHFEVQDLNISDELKHEIQVWDEEYQDTLDSAYPPDSSFTTPEMQQRHQQRGLTLAEKLQRELGDNYIVEYKA